MIKKSRFESSARESRMRIGFNEKLFSLIKSIRNAGEMFLRVQCCRSAIKNKVFVIPWLAINPSWWLHRFLHNFQLIDYNWYIRLLLINLFEHASSTTSLHCLGNDSHFFIINLPKICHFIEIPQEKSLKKFLTWWSLLIGSMRSIKSFIDVVNIDFDSKRKLALTLAALSRED